MGDRGLYPISHLPSSSSSFDEQRALFPVLGFLLHGLHEAAALLVAQIADAVAHLQKLHELFTGNIRVSAGFVEPQKTPNTIETDKYP